MRAMKWFLVVVAALVLLVVAAVVAVPFLVDTPRVQAAIASQASAALGRPVKFRALSVKVLPLPGVVLRDLEVGEDPAFGTEPFLRLQAGELRLQVGPLLRGRVEFGELVLRRPVITVIQNPDGRLNVATLGAAPSAKPPAPPPGAPAPAPSPAPMALPASSVRIANGVVSYVSRGARGATSRYQVEGLDLRLAGTPSEITFRGEGRLVPGHLALTLADGVIALDGKALTDAPLRGTLTLDGRDIGELVAAAAGPTPAIGGGLRGSLALGGTVGNPAAKGDVELTRLTVTQTNAACPEPKMRTLTLPAVNVAAAYGDGRLTGRPVTTSLGGGTIAARMVVTLAEGPRVELGDLAIRGVPVETVLVDYLCQGYAVTGPMDLGGSLSFSAADLLGTLSGPGKVKIGPGKVVGPQALALVSTVIRVGGAASALLGGPVSDLGSEPLDYDSITATYQLTNGVLATRDLRVTSRTVQISAAGDYALPTGRVNMDVTIHHRRGQLQARITGNAASPSIRVNPAALLRDVDPEKVERGLQDLLRRFR
jgi:AsmA protein